MRRSTQRYWSSGETYSTWSFGKDGNSYRKFYQCTATKKLSARIRAKIRTFVRRPEIIQTMFSCGFEVCRTRTILLLSWKTDATFLPRIHDISQSKRDSFKSALSWTSKFAIMMIDTVSKFKFHVILKTILFLGSESWMALISTWQNRCRPRKKRT